MRMSARAEYAVRAMAELAAHDPGEPTPAEVIATAQDIPLKFLLAILRDLGRAELVASRRGREGGYYLARDGSDITLADVIRAIDGPLASVRDLDLVRHKYVGAAAPLTDVWLAVRTSLRSVLEEVTVTDLANGRLPQHVTAMAKQYRRRLHSAAVRSGRLPNR